VKKFRNHVPDSSLELLLDTICNMFGSVILITLLIVIITSDIPHSHEQKRHNNPNKDELDRLIDVADKKIDALRLDLAKYPDSNTSNSTDDSNIQNEIDRKIAILNEIRNQQGNAPQNVGDWIKNINIQIEFNKSQISQANISINATENRRSTLESERNALIEFSNRETKRRSDQVRLPKESDTSKSAYYVFCKYGLIYPQYLFDRRGEAIPNPSVNKIREDSTSIEYVPIIGKGSPPTENDIAALLSNLPTNYYIACNLYPDSIEAFKQLRKYAAKAKIDIGWKPASPDQRLVFTTENGVPPPKPQ